MSSSEIDDILSRALDLGVEELFYDSTDEIKNIPEPPPLPSLQPSRRNPPSSSSSRLVPKEVVETWDKLFKEAYGANVIIETNNNTGLLAHSSVLTAASPVIATLLNQSWDKNGNSYLKIIGVPCEAAYMFIRFLYSSCYEEEEMKKYVLHLLVLSHCYSVPYLKRVCVEFLDQGWINTENVIDVLQLARNCDAPRISLKCVSMIIKEFKSVSSTEGWKVMKQANPELEKELVEITVESEARKQERRRKLKERKVYLQVYEVMEALVHICRDGCKTIGPKDKELKGKVCKFPACKGLEDGLRHFLECKFRASCVRCKRMWQLLQLHSCLCDDDDDSCSVPLCGNFKEKMEEMSKRAKSRWRLLVEKIITVKKSLGPFSSRSFGLI